MVGRRVLATALAAAVLAGSLPLSPTAGNSSSEKTRLTSTPHGVTTDTTPTFAFDAAAGAAHECRLDFGAWFICASPLTLGPLANGSHTFQVRILDSSQSPAVEPFEVVNSPGTIVVRGPNTHGIRQPPSGRDYVQVAIGNYHGLALTADGTIVGWGYNQHDQAAPPGGSDFVAIAAGAEHSLALRSDGSIVGWGNDELGQASAPPGTDYVAIAAGLRHSLALRSDGTIAGWGSDSEGQASPPPTDVFVAIAAGVAHSFALTATGEIVRWGRDTALLAPPPGAGFVGVASGAHSGVARRSDGSLVGWGTDYNHADTPPAGSGFVAVAAGGYEGVALASDGSLAPWRFTEAPVGVGYVAVGAGWSHMAAISPDTSPPDGPTEVSTSHDVGVWSRNRFLRAYWEGTTDAESGVDGFSYAWDQLADTVPDTAIDLQEGIAEVAGPQADGAWYFHVRAVDNAGNWGEAKHIGPLLLDLIAPTNPTLRSTSHQPGSHSNDNTVDVSWLDALDANGSGVAGYSLVWDRDEYGWPDDVIDLDATATATTSPTLAHGVWHWFHLRTVDYAGNWSQPVTIGPFPIDLVAPSTIFTFGPDDGGYSASNQPTFQFTPSDAAAFFECSLDSAPFTICTSPHVVGPLADGAHTLSVRGTDAAGNVGLPATRAFTVDTIAPVSPTISAGPADGAYINSQQPTFHFSATDAGPLTFECKMDGGSFSACTSPTVVGPLQQGAHTFQARSIDVAGNVSTATTRTFTVDTTSPSASFVAGPDEGSVIANRQPSFAFVANEPSTFECRLGAGTWATCISPVSIGPLTDGAHAFSVRAIDRAGNTLGHVSRGFTVDTAAPVANISSGPAHGSTIALATPSFTFTADELATYECKVDSQAYSSCTSPRMIGPLSEGQHTFAVRAIDSAGNVGTPVARTFTVDAFFERPDLEIRKSSETAFLGDGVYNGDASGQTRAVSIKRGASRTFVVRLRNDGDAADTFRLSGPGSNAQFKVTYWKGISSSTNLTAQIVAGTYRTPTLTVGTARLFRIVVKVRAGAARGARLDVLLTAASQRDATKTDAVKARVSVL